MDAFAKMDIFFVVTTLAIIIVALFVAALLFYIIRTARDVSEVVHIVRRETERFAKGASSARTRIKGRGENLLQSFIAFVQTLAPTKKRGQKDTK